MTYVTNVTRWGVGRGLSVYSVQGGLLGNVATTRGTCRRGMDKGIMFPGGCFQAPYGVDIPAASRPAGGGRVVEGSTTSSAGD